MWITAWRDWYEGRSKELARLREENERLRQENERLRHWLNYLVEYIRADQCGPDLACECCPDYLSVANHCAKRAFEPNGSQ